MTPAEKQQFFEIWDSLYHALAQDRREAQAETRTSRAVKDVLGYLLMATRFDAEHPAFQAGHCFYRLEQGLVKDHHAQEPETAVHAAARAALRDLMSFTAEPQS